MLVVALQPRQHLLRRLAGNEHLEPSLRDPFPHVRSQRIGLAAPVRTAPGEIAQVDFGYVGQFYDGGAGVLRRAWVFVMVLAYSRHLFARVAFDQRTQRKHSPGNEV